jgi:hypothetical protein
VIGVTAEPGLPLELPRTSVEAPPAVSPRMEFTSIAQFVDFEMQRVPGQTLRLQHAQDRARLRNWLQLAIEGYLNVLAWDLSKAADRGIRQAMQLMTDPSYYEQRKERSRRAREHSRVQAEEARERYLAELAAERAEEERLIAEGKLARMQPRPPGEDGAS